MYRQVLSIIHLVYMYSKDYINMNDILKATSKILIRDTLQTIIAPILSLNFQVATS